MNKIKGLTKNESINNGNGKEKFSFGRRLLNSLEKVWNLQESGIIVPTIIFAIFVQFVNPVFLSTQNITNILRQSGFILIPAIGMTLVLIAGGLDLSVGSVLGLGSFAVGFCMVKLNLPIWLSIIAAILAGIVIGLINGKIIVKFNIPPIIMTLGMMYMARGLIYVSTKGLPIYPLPKQFQAIEQNAVFVLPTIVIICVILCIIFHVVLTRTTFGRSVYAIGGNPEAAKLSGINIDNVKMMVYAISGMMAAIAGIIMASRLGSAQPNTGETYEMNVIAACIIGGTSTFGGRGTILGTTVGALLMSMLANSMTLMKVDVYYQKLVIGAVLVIAVIIDQYKRKLAESNAKASK